MAPYFLMLALPSLLALRGARFSIELWRLLALFYWLMIGFRFRVGTDWNNYLRINHWLEGPGRGDLVLGREPAFGLLVWLAHQIGGGYIFVNAVSALVFCWGFFAFAKRCPEPFIAVAVATPLVVIALAMNLTRQAMALGIIAYLYSTWDRRGLLGRTAFVLLACLFHFSAVFFLIFVALSTEASRFARFAAAAAAGLAIVAITYFAPDAMESYSRLYASGKVKAPGALAHVVVLATAATLYLLFQTKWAAVRGANLLYWNLAVAALFAVPTVYFSSVAAYRFSLYLWPMAMYVFSGMPSIIDTPAGRTIYRVVAVSASGLLLFSWLTFANNSADWLPYQSWLLQPEHVRLRR